MKPKMILPLLLLAFGANFAVASDKEFVCNASYTVSESDINSRSFIDIKSFDGTYDSRNLHEVFATDLDFFNGFTKVATIILKSPESKSDFTIAIKKMLDRSNDFGVFSVSVTQSSFPTNGKNSYVKDLTSTQAMFEINKLNELNGLYLESVKSGVRQIFAKCFIRLK